MRSNPSGKGSHIITKEEEVIRHSQDICPNHLSWPDWGSGWPRMFQNYRPLPSSNWRWFFIELRFASLSITMLVIIMRKRNQYKWKTSEEGKILKIFKATLAKRLTISVQLNCAENHTLHFRFCAPSICPKARLLRNIIAQTSQPQFMLYKETLFSEQGQNLKNLWSRKWQNRK